MYPLLHNSTEKINYEIICVNDGSTDNTKEILNKFACENERLKIVHTENGGVSSARNIGLRKAAGKYVTFVDADDTVSFAALIEMLEIAEKEEVDIVIGQQTNGKEKCGKCQIEFFDGLEPLKKSIEDHKAFYSVWGKIYKKTFIDGIFFVEGKRVHEDSFFCFQCCCKKPKVALTNIPVYNYIVRKGSASRAAFSEKFFDIRYFCERKCEIIEKEFSELEPLLHNLRIKASLSLLGCLLKAGKEYRQEEKREIAIVRKERKYFKAAIKRDKILFLIVRFGCYFLYKKVYHLIRK